TSTVSLSTGMCTHPYFKYKRLGTQSVLRQRSLAAGGVTDPVLLHVQMQVNFVLRNEIAGVPGFGKGTHGKRMCRKVEKRIAGDTQLRLAFSRKYQRACIHSVAIFLRSYVWIG